MLETWNTSTHCANERFDAWQSALNQSHLEWELKPSQAPEFAARIRQRTLDGVRIVDCRCDPCIGSRGRIQLSQSDGAYFGILFELQGREVVRQDNHEAVLKAGDFVMWDSEREMDFRVLEPLHKLTILIPKPRLRAFLGDPDCYTGIVVQGSGKGNGFVADALKRLAREFSVINEGEAGRVLEPVFSLLSSTLMTHPMGPSVSSGHSDSFRRFCQHIERNLCDSELTPVSVAAATCVSLRYLQSVFAQHGTSFVRFLRQRRLAHCHRELSYASRDTTITEIAFRWGFNDMAHFSRAFSAEFGLPPRAVIHTNRRVPDLEL